MTSEATPNIMRETSRKDCASYTDLGFTLSCMDAIVWTFSQWKKKANIEMMVTVSAIAALLEIANQSLV